MLGNAISAWHARGRRFDPVWLHQSFPHSPRSPLVPSLGPGGPQSFSAASATASGAPEKPNTIPGEPLAAAAPGTLRTRHPLYQTRPKTPQEGQPRGHKASTGAAAP